MKRNILISVVLLGTIFFLSAFLPGSRPSWLQAVWPARLQAPLDVADIAVAKTDLADPVLVGDTITYSIVITNLDLSAPTGPIVMTDTLPSAVTFVSVTPGPTTCNYDSGNHQVLCTLSPLAAGANVTVTIMVDTDSASPGTINNTVTVENQDGDPEPVNNTDQETTVIVAGTDLAITKTDSVDPVLAGNSLTYTLSVTNLGPISAAGVSVSDTLPAMLTYESSSVGCSFASGTVTCALGNLGVGAQQDVTITARVAPDFSGLINNTANVTSSTPRINTGDDSSLQQTVVNAQANLAIGKTASPTTATAGNPLTYTLTITNAGPSNAAGVTVVDTLPTGVSYTGYSSTSFSCTHSGGVVTCTLNDASLPVSSPRTINITAQVSPSATGSLTNVAQVSATTSDPTPGNNIASLITPVSTSADLSISKTANPSPATAGSLLTYQLTVNNLGPSNATGVTVVDTLPANVSYTGFSASSFNCTHASGIVTCTSTEASLPVNSPRTISITVRPGAWVTSTLTNTVSISASTQDPVSSNNSFTLNTPVVTSADLSISKSGNPTALAPGATLVYVIRVNNLGPSDARDVVVTDTLPAQVLYQSIAYSQGSCSGVSTISCGLGTLSYNTTAAITVTVTVRDETPLNTTISNTATVTSTTSDPSNGNNQSTANTTVADRLIDLQVAVSDSSDPIAAGLPLTYTITVTNAGPSTATNVVLTDTLPAQVSFVSSNPSSPTCTHTGGTVRCSLGLIAAGTNQVVTIRADVPPGFSGELTNQTTAAAAEYDQNPANNTQIVETTQVVINADLSVDIIDQPDPVIPGNNLQYQIRAINNGPSNAANVRVSFTLPNGVTFLNSVPGAPTCALQSGVVNCTLGAMNRQASAQVTVTVRVNPSTTLNLNSSAVVVSDSLDPQAGNNTTTETTIVTPFADLQLSITDTPDPVRDSGTLTYTLRVTNAGPSNAFGLTLVNTLPENVTFSSVNPGSPTCTRSNRTITCTLSTLAAGSSWQVVIRSQVNSSATGNLINSANVSSSTSDLSPGNNSAQATTTVDRETPNLTWISPGPDAGYYNVGPTVRLLVEVTDDVGVDRVAFALWDRVNLFWIPLYTDYTPPYSYDLNTWLIPTDYNQIKATAYDRAGRESIYDKDHGWVFIFVTSYLFLPFAVH